MVGEVVAFSAFDEAKENCLQHIFGIGGAAGDAMSGAKDPIVVCSEEIFQLSRRVWLWFQGSSDCWHDALLKLFPLSKRAAGGTINRRGELFSLKMGRKTIFGA
jgi:hypothetical protein